MKSKSLWLSLLLTTAVVFTSCGDKSSTEQEENVKYVKSTEALPIDGSSKLIYNGVVKENRQVTLSFKVGGPVQELSVDAGDYVQKGQILARIDKRDYRVKVQATEAQYKQAKAEYERYQELYERKKLPKNTLDKLEAGFLMAKSQYEAAANALSDTDLKAPFSGYINKKMIENYQTVGAGQPIVELLDFSNLEVVVSIPEGQINEMSEVARITCDIRNANLFNIPAKIKTISKKTGDDSMFEAKILLDADSLDMVKPGMVAKVKVIQKISENAGLLVPVEAVFAQAGKQYIWVIDRDMSVKKHEVTASKIHGDGLMEIKSEIKTGEKVVTAGVHSLIEGQKVKILPKKSATNIGGLL
ncbi:efflux RND transporter periplasmic adaptor subunit [Saccharicrinis fermentans]|uniref:Efflux pump periplasmic linker BepF n=1 Tax=Saccharicrinis fermentans DSM 9555 = JCM 21142 TaxID=869213 RepID=W7YAR6_9BACT|nr:efflux RND transporter periplasmic adaptor subunit [Saccharicrinis fermentans]GAF01446.1 efflux pump periplasmic linker BepF [Saccharicrinis fermentans DSM 9555 = JCM 21142]